jgi:hypothetical protein
VVDLAEKAVLREALEGQAVRQDIQTHLLELAQQDKGLTQELAQGLLVIFTRLVVAVVLVALA